MDNTIRVDEDKHRGLMLGLGSQLRVRCQPTDPGSGAAGITVTVWTFSTNHTILESSLKVDLGVHLEVVSCCTCCGGIKCYVNTLWGAPAIAGPITHPFLCSSAVSPTYITLASARNRNLAIDPLLIFRQCSTNIDMDIDSANTSRYEQ